MKPTFRKQYGSTRDRDRLLIYQHVSADGDLYTIADRPMSWRNGMFGVWQDGETYQERQEYMERYEREAYHDAEWRFIARQREREQRRDEYLRSRAMAPEYERLMLTPSPCADNLTVQQLRDAGCEMLALAREDRELNNTIEIETLPQHEATPEQVAEQREDLAPLMRTAIAFDRKVWKQQKIEGLATVSERHAQWLCEMAMHRPDAFALKQKLAKAV